MLKNFADKWSSVTNLTVRGLTIVSRFVLLFCLGKYFSTEDLGTYGLFYTTISLCLLTLGLDFYTYANREVLYAREEERLTILRNQMLFFGLTYVIILPLLLLVFLWDVLPAAYIVFFYLILVCEHLSQEFYRLFTVLSFPVLANWLLFLRNGLWVFVLITLYLCLDITTYSLRYVFTAWLAGSFLSVIIGFVRVLKLYGHYHLRPVNKEWFYRGMKTSSLFFLSTISLIVIEQFNRYYINHWCGLAEVGIFTFYSQMTNAINVVIFTLFIMVIYPKMISAVNAGNPDEYGRLKGKLSKTVTWYSLGMGLLLAAGIYPVLLFINKPEYFENILTFFLLITSTILLNVSYVKHYALYALKEDMRLFYSTLIGAASSVILNFVLISRFGINGAAAALALSYLVLLITKTVYLRKAETLFLTKKIVL